MRVPNRGHVKLIVVLFCVVFTFTIVFSDVNYRVEEGKTLPKPTSASFRRVQVTKSLAELPKVPELSDHILMFNRIPKSGSEMFVFLLQKLQGNKFVHIRLGNGESKRLDHNQQRAFVDRVSDIIREKAVPISFDRAVHFTNFTEFGTQSPIYFNVMRDPFENLMSRLMPQSHKKYTSINQMEILAEGFKECHESPCKLFNGESYEFTTPYFCGHKTECSHVDKRSLNRAKEIVDRYYPVVGLLEYLNETLTVLESELPLFFKGSRNLYDKNLSATFKNWKFKNKFDSTLRDRFKNNLAIEYDFYNWLKERLFNQMKHVKTDDIQNYELFLRYQ